MFDVAIIGGGPAGTTAATILRKYAPDLRVLILEREKFPRDHIGESQLPSIGKVLDEMGVWDKIEAANFPIKIGASYTWGKHSDRWDFNFVPPESWVDEPRPGTFAGQRRIVAFQVDRSIYDTILLRHAESMGVIVREETGVEEVLHTDNRVDGLRLMNGEVVTARWYVDASGVVGILRRALGIGSDVVKELRNIAIWDYWRDAKWAIEIGTGGTRVQIRSLPYGWIWFIPIGPTRTSIGLVTPVEHYRARSTPPEELYLDALREQPEIAKLVAGAEREGTIRSCKDWSQLSDRIIGENWVLVGEVCGFADPILSAGLSLAHASARDAAYTILELDRGELDAAWLRARFDERNRTNVLQHIRFAQYWYSANSCFTELRDNCQAIAAESGIRLTPQAAWEWLSQGGFTTEHLGLPSSGTFDVASSRQLIGLFSGEGSAKPGYLMNGYNKFTLNLKGATKCVIGLLHDGRIHQVECYERGGHRLPRVGYYGAVLNALEQTSDIQTIVKSLETAAQTTNPGAPASFAQLHVSLVLQALEVMIQQHWVHRKVDKKRPTIHVDHVGSRYIRTAEADRQAIADGTISRVKSNLD